MSNLKQPSSSNESSTGHGNSFLRNSSNVPTPVSREIANDEFLVDKEDKINQSIKSWFITPLIKG